MEDKKENKNFFKRWSEKKANLGKDHSSIDKKIKKKRKNQILESNEDIDKKYEKMSNNEILDQLNLPDPNKIKKEEDLDVFFKSTIPERLKRIAMRRLWRINPIISFADAEINDYADDFTDAANVIDDLQTSYVVGKGHSYLDLDKKLEDSVQETKKEKNKISNNQKKLLEKKEIKSVNKIKTKKVVKKQNEQKSSSNIKIATENNTVKNKDIKSEYQYQSENMNSTKIKPKNLAFRKKL